MRRLLILVLLALAGSAHAQVGAPLIDGLGGPYDVGAPHDGGADVPLAPALPQGVRYYADALEPDIRVNWVGSLSFDGFDDIDGVPIPGPLDAIGRGLRRIVPFQHSSELAQFDPLVNDPPWPTYVGQIPPGADGTPGRFVATWYQVTDRRPREGRPDPLLNTWQAILTGPDPDDYEVEFRYHRCEWIYGILREDEPAAMGFDGGEGPDGPGWMWPGSLSDDMRHLCRLSNVREPGVFRYRVIDGIPTGCGIARPPGDDRCDDGNHLPGDGCSPACYVEPDIDGDGRTEAPHPDSIDPFGVYDDCTDLDDPLCNDNIDGDGIPEHADNCPEVANPLQRDYDADRVGDACDPDPDDDTLPDIADPDAPDLFPADLCPLLYSRGTRRVDPIQPAFVQQPDIDGDGIGDACDPDDDGDGILDCGGDGICDPDDDGYNNDIDVQTDEGDECPPESACDNGAHDLFDNDADGFVDEWTEREHPFARWPGPDAPPSRPEDNCRRIPNPDQADLDGDGIGDACDPDLDGDGIPNCEGNGICGPWLDGRDNDLDGTIDEAEECAEGCDPAADLIDQDLDGWVDEHLEVEQALLDGATLPAAHDNCPRVAGEDQSDRDGDGIGDLCDDSDGDGVVDATDNCPDTPNRDQADLDADGLGDACDDDRDGDGILDARDSCPDAPDTRTDTDGDGIDDACDPDDDEDGVNDPFDGCPRAYDPDQADLDGDGMGDVCDPDDDADGTPDAADVCPRLADEQTDTDGDGTGDACDLDDDDDGIADDVDGCPLTPDTEQPDLDGDGIGDACDPTDDRPFEARTREERCAILIEQRAPTAERLVHCPRADGGGCAVTPGGSAPPPGGPIAALVVLASTLCRRRRRPPAPGSDARAERAGPGEEPLADRAGRV